MTGGRPPPGSGALALDRYRLVERIGAGGFGVVWRARDEHLERDVAVKAIPRVDTAEAGLADRPLREARAAARLNHPGIVALYEMGADPETIYLVSELVHGRTFADLDREGALSDRDIARIGTALADALVHAHARGVIHRDVKPQNVLVVAEPATGAGFAKLTDFGVAHLVGDDPLTRTGDVVGTLAYMAPEQAEGRRPTAACDVYALALTLFEGLAGENPKRGRTPAETARLVGRRPPPLLSYRRELPEDLCAVLDAALDPHPERRPPLDEVRDAIAENAPLLESQGGLVEPATLARVGLPAPGEAPAEHVEGETPVTRFAAPAEIASPALESPTDRVPPPASAPAEPRPAWPPPEAPAAPGERRPPLASLWPHAAAGLGAAALTALALLLPESEPPVAVATAAVLAAAAVALLPRLGWLVLAFGVVAWLAAAGLEGAALLVALPLAATPLLLPRAGTAWSVPGLAALLGLVGLAPAFVAIAGLGRTMPRRAGLGAAGALWLSAAEAVAGDRFLYAAPAAVPDPSLWTGSITAAATEALPPFVTTLALAPALVWAAFACLFPLAMRGRSLRSDAARGLLWAGGLAAALVLLGGPISAADTPAEARGALAGPVVAVVAGLAVTALRQRRREALGRPADNPLRRPGGGA